MDISLSQSILQTAIKAKQAARQLLRVDDKMKSSALLTLAQLIRQEKTFLQSENQKDLDLARSNGLESALLDRLTLSDKSIETMIKGLEQIANMSDPVGSLSETIVRPNGMQVAKMRIPLGVIGIIYESRPNVTVDAAALCLKTGNATLLRGGSEAFHSNMALGKLIQQALKTSGLPEAAVQVINTTDRAAIDEMITLADYIDVIIPRGGKGLIKRLIEKSKVPLIKHLDGNCHVYIDKQADLTKGVDIAVNAKTYRYGICGSMETLLVHQAVAQEYLPKLAKALIAKGVELRGCEKTQAIVAQANAATIEDWQTEYLGPILAIRVVDDIDQAMEHIGQYSSGHTESIVTESMQQAQRFQREVDSSSVYVNLPTCFADGFEYGLGAEIGISTNRLHARGPVGLEGLTTYKWVLSGNGQLRA